MRHDVIIGPCFLHDEVHAYTASMHAGASVVVPLCVERNSFDHQGSPCRILEDLQSIEALCLRDNGLTELPRSIWSIRTLVNLDLSDNLLVALPPAIGQLKHLKVSQVLYHLC